MQPDLRNQICQALRGRTEREELYDSRPSSLGMTSASTLYSGRAMYRLRSSSLLDVSTVCIFKLDDHAPGMVSTIPVPVFVLVLRCTLRLDLVAATETLRVPEIGCVITGMNDREFVSETAPFGIDGKGDGERYREQEPDAHCDLRLPVLKSVRYTIMKTFFPEAACSNSRSHSYSQG